MFRIESKIKISSPEFQQNRVEFLKLLGQYNEILATAREGGPGQAVLRHKERGKLLARERIDLLVDRNTPFIELSPLAAYGLYENGFPSAGIITGIGVIYGKEVMIVANDATVKGGTYVKETIKKHVRAQEIAMENRLPCVYLVDSGGVFLPEQANVFPDKYDFGRFFFNQDHLEQGRLPRSRVTDNRNKFLRGNGKADVFQGNTIIRIYFCDLIEINHDELALQLYTTSHHYQRISITFSPPR